MSNVYFPAHVVLVLRRIANIISTLSISNHYLLPSRDPDLSTYRPVNMQSPAIQIPTLRCAAVHTKDLGWYWVSWDWPRFIDSPSLLSTTVPISSEVFSSRRKRRHWSWRSLFTTTRCATPTLDTVTTPSIPPIPQNVSLPDTNPPNTPSPEVKQTPAPLNSIHQLMFYPLLYDPLRTPRYPIVLCHGLYGFDTRGPTKFPSLRMHYWANVLNILRDTLRAEVIVTSVPGTGSIITRAEALDRQLQIKARGRGVNFVAHSMGGLDCRHLITHVRPEVYAPLSLTSLSTPHRGSPFMDWCVNNLGIGKLNHSEKDLGNSMLPKPLLVDPLPRDPVSNHKLDTLFSLASLSSSFTTLLLSIVDTPAYANLTTAFLNDVFNPSTPDDPTVKYFSVAARTDNVSIWHPLWFTKQVLDSFEKENTGVTDTSDRGNDGLVTIQSAKWGEFLGVLEGCDHWEIRGSRGIEFGQDLPAFPALGLGNSMSGHRGPTSNSGNDGRALSDWVRLSRIWTNHSSPAKVGSGTSAERELQRERKRANDDAVVKSSTDKLSAVLDWLIEQVPSPSLLGTKTTVEVQARSVEALSTLTRRVAPVDHKQASHEKERKRSDLETKEDLERFYVALSKRLYDEGF